MTVSAVVLRNKGVPVDLHPTAWDNEAQDWVVPENSKGSPTVEKVWLRFDANGIADIEDCFGTMEQFQTESGEKPTATLRKVLAICLGWDWSNPSHVRRAGKAMLPSKTDDYATAISVALAIANGMDPTQAVDILDVGVTATKIVKDEQYKLLSSTLSGAKEAIGTFQAENSPGETGPTTGAEPAGP